MIIRCKSSKRFLGKIDTKTFFENLKKTTGINIEIPITIEIPCKRCGMIEVYEVYQNKCSHVRSYKNNK